MQKPTLFKHLNQHFWLSSERVIFWEEEKALIVSDLHFGKTGHFRKAGIGIPQNVFKEDLLRLLSQVQYFKPEKLIVVGDFFHSKANKELELFARWREDIGDMEIHLIKGNHDILSDAWYSQTNIHVHNEMMQIGEIAFVHDCEHIDHLPSAAYYFCGHMHPGIVVYGLGKQSLKFPCFYFRNDYAILPAFGKFTGLALIDPEPGELVFAIVEKSIITLHGKKHSV